MKFSQLQAVDGAAKTLHESPIEPIIALVLRLINEVEITIDQPSPGARGCQVLQLRQECLLQGVIGRPIDCRDQQSATLAPSTSVSNTLIEKEAMAALEPCH